MSNTEQKLVQACVKGDRAAQRQLYEQYKQPLFRLCLRYARDSQEAEDYLHEGFLKIFQDLHQFRGKGVLGGWLRRVTLNVCLQQIRHQRRTIFPENMLLLMGESAAEEVPPAPYDMQELIRVIQQLPAGYRAVFNLFVIENYSHQAIAQELGISVGASKSQLSKAKAMLRRNLAKKAVS